MDTACWPPPGQDFLSRSLSGSENGPTFFVRCHCLEWQEGGFETPSAATDALVAHRGESPPGTE